MIIRRAGNHKVKRDTLMTAKTDLYRGGANN